MEVTEESLLSFLIAQGGKVKNSDLVAEFKASLNCADLAEKKQNRAVFKSAVNNVAFVKELDGVKYVMVKKKHQHLLKENQTQEEQTEQTPRPDAMVERREEAETHHEGGAEGERGIPEANQEQTEGDANENAAELSPIQLALQRSRFDSFRLKRTLHFDIVEDASVFRPMSQSGTSSTTHHKPFALPLRMPPSVSANTRVEIHTLKGDPDNPPESPDVFRSKRRPSGERCGPVSPRPSPRPAVKTSPKQPEELREPRLPSTVPLEQSEHEWLVRCASGHWSQAYGLLLRDNQLAEKRDFISGFTALHWAAKSGNSDMLAKIIAMSKQGGADVDVNTKTHGGYTPLHIAALHHQEFILAMLVEEFGADANIRDNCGKRAYHYLHKGISERVRELLGEPKAPPQVQESSQGDKEELDVFQSKGLHTISRLFQPHGTGHRKKHKQRPGLLTLSEEGREEHDESTPKHRALSGAFMY